MLRFTVGPAALHSRRRDATQAASVRFTDEGNEVSSRDGRDWLNEQTRSPVGANAMVVCPLLCRKEAGYDIIRAVVSGWNCRFDHEQEARAEGLNGSVS